MQKKNKKNNAKAAKVSDLKPVRNPKGGIGSQSTGAGAGKVTFNPFSITKKID